MIKSIGVIQDGLKELIIIFRKNRSKYDVKYIWKMLTFLIFKLSSNKVVVNHKTLLIKQVWRVLKT